MNGDESTDRSLVDYVHFGLGFSGFILSSTGIIIISVKVALIGALLLAISLAYFLFED